MLLPCLHGGIARGISRTYDYSREVPIATKFCVHPSAKPGAFAGTERTSGRHLARDYENAFPGPSVNRT